MPKKDQTMTGIAGAVVHTQSSTMILPTHITESPIPDTDICPSTGKLTATHQGQSMSTTTPAAAELDQVSFDDKPRVQLSFQNIARPL